MHVRIIIFFFLRFSAQIDVSLVYSDTFQDFDLRRTLLFELGLSILLSRDPNDSPFTSRFNPPRVNVPWQLGKDLFNFRVVIILLILLDLSRRNRRTSAARSREWRFRRAANKRKKRRRGGRGGRRRRRRKEETKMRERDFGASGRAYVWAPYPTSDSRPASGASVNLVSRVAIHGAR